MRPNLLQRKARSQKSELVSKVYQAAGFLPSLDSRLHEPTATGAQVPCQVGSQIRCLMALWAPDSRFPTADLKFGSIRLSGKTGPYWVSSLKPPVIRYQSFFRRLQSVL